MNISLLTTPNSENRLNAFLRQLWVHHIAGQRLYHHVPPANAFVDPAQAKTILLTLAITPEQRQAVTQTFEYPLTPDTLWLRVRQALEQFDQIWLHKCDEQFSEHLYLPTVDIP